MAELRHIERIFDTQSNGRSSLDAKQIMVESDGDHLFTWKDNEVTPRYYTVAAQHYWNGASLTYLDVDFNDVTANGDIYTAQYLYHIGDTDTRIQFETDQITITVGGVDFIDMVEGASDLMTFNTDVLFAAGTQDYKLSSRSTQLTLQSQTAGTNTGLELYSADGDGTDNVFTYCYAKGTPSQDTDIEYFRFGYQSTGTFFEITSQANGTGTLLPIALYTEGNTDQLVLATDNKVGINKAPTLATLDINGNLAIGTIADDGDASTTVLVDDGTGLIKSNVIDSRVWGTSLADLSNGVNNRVVTASDANSLNGEANLTFDGSELALTGTFYAANIGAGTDDSVVVLTSSGYLKTDEIDTKVWDGCLVDSLTGGTDNHLVKWTDGMSNTAGDSQVYDNGTNVSIGAESSLAKLHVITASAGTTTLGTDGLVADDLIVENSGHTGMSIIAPTECRSAIHLRSTETVNGKGARIEYDNDSVSNYQSAFRIYDSYAAQRIMSSIYDDGDLIDGESILAVSFGKEAQLPVSTYGKYQFDVPTNDLGIVDCNETNKHIEILVNGTTYYIPFTSSATAAW